MFPMASREPDILGNDLAKGGLVSFIQAYESMWLNYFNFSGRTSRATYWKAWLVNIVVTVILYLLALHSSPAAFLVSLYSLASIVPGIAMAVRRLHDTNRSGFWWLIAFVPFVGGIVLIVFLLLASYPQENRWGLPPTSPPQVTQGGW